MLNDYAKYRIVPNDNKIIKLCRMTDQRRSGVFKTVLISTEDRSLPKCPTLG